MQSDKTLNTQTYLFPNIQQIEIFLNYTEKLKNFMWATFENHWDLLLPECAKREKKQMYHTQNFYEKPYCPTKETSVIT